MPKGDEPVPDFSSSPPACEGYLWKRSDHIKKWNKRWFVLWPEANRPGDGRVLFWFDKPGDKKAKGSVKLIPGSFNLQSQHGQGKGDRDFPLTVLIEVPDRDSVRVATDNERETRGWMDAMQSMESPRAGAAASNGGLGAPPEGPSLTPNLSATRTKGFDGQAAPRGRASIADSGGDASAVLREALLLFLPGADVGAGGKDLLAQARYAASQREKTVEHEGELEAAKRSAEQLKERLRVSEDAAVEMQQAHEADLAAKEEALSELRGENQLLKTTLESLERASASSGGSALQEIASNGNSEAAQREVELEQATADLREQVAQLQDETVAVKSRLAQSEAQAQKLQMENRAMRAQLESAADSGATDTERLAEVKLENSELMAAVMEARAATSQAEMLAAAEKATADALREQREGVDAQLASTRTDLGEQKAAVQQLSEELETLSEAVVADAGSAEKIEELEMIVEELENQVTEESEAKKGAEEALAASEAKLKQAVEMARDKVMALSKENAELKKGRRK